MTLKQFVVFITSFTALFTLLISSNSFGADCPSAKDIYEVALCLEEKIRTSKSLLNTSFLEEVSTKKNTIQKLGPHIACFLSTVGTIHHNQSCTCKIDVESPNNKNWILTVSLDETVDGTCRCRAMCID